MENVVGTPCRLRDVLVLFFLRFICIYITHPMVYQFIINCVPINMDIEQGAFRNKLQQCSPILGAHRYSMIGFAPMKMAVDRFFKPDEAQAMEGLLLCFSDVTTVAKGKWVCSQP